MLLRRRRFLEASLGAVCGAFGTRALARPTAATPHYASAFSTAEGMPKAGVFSGEGEMLAAWPLPGRGHAVAGHPGRSEIVVFARRPGTFALVFNPLSDAPPRHIESRPDRHFYGHGAYSADGRWLFATENDFDRGRGCIGVYDAVAGYRREHEFEAYGIGPHEIALLGDGRQLLVANGGIQTHPARGRRKLNLASMSPSLAYIDSASGALLQQHRLPPALHQLSIRHLAVAPDGQVVLGMQYEGPRDRQVPLVAFQRGGEDIEVAMTEPGALRAMRHYVGSVAVDAAGQIAVATAPRGGVMTFWSLGERRYLGGLRLGDGCGAAPAGLPGRFLLSSGFGRLLTHNLVSGLSEPADLSPVGIAWDNHLTALWLPR